MAFLFSPGIYGNGCFFPSMDEAVKITGQTDPELIAECFKKFPMKAFGIKMGAKGCFVTDFKEKGLSNARKGCLW